ncbi:macrophage mannose receptor 1-like [Scomber scombrus]|uniref:macrophage mannose receptor 1-like n=1 Tax=Scomber scombrus TaxID=13677 RepID=UPI002DDB7F29|nr:macrophage mannose receptor 1-like [Scomber scombrus]
MTEAQSYCRDKYTDLATIDDMEDVKTLTDMVDLNKMVLDEYGQKTAWIGLYHDMDSLRWSDRHAEVEFTNWAKGQPDNYKSGEHCTEMYNTGEWNDVPCNGTLQAVCSSVRGSDVTFILINSTMSWTEAQSYCRANYTDLATVRNEAENKEVKNLAGGQSVWIGLFRDWKWSDGSKSSFRYWASGEPNNYGGKRACVVMNFHRSGRWGDWTCDQNKPFICYKDPTTEEPNWTLRPFPTSVPSASTPATTQSLISSSGSFTPSSSFPETTEQFAETEGGNVTRVCNAAVYGSMKFFCKDECKKEEDILVETAENRALNGRYSIKYIEGSGMYVTITQLEKSDTGRYKCGYGRALSPDSFDWFPIIVVDAVSGVSLPGYFWPLVASMSLIIVLVAVVLLFVYKLMMRRNSGLKTRETSDSRNMELSVVNEYRPPVPMTENEIYSTFTETTNK